MLTAACGNFSDQDTLAGDGSFAVHWWCGVGWPESAAAEGPITEYCVEYQPIEAPTRMGGKCMQCLYRLHQADHKRQIARASELETSTGSERQWSRDKSI